MKRLLLVCSTLSATRSAREAAISWSAKHRAELVAVFIVDPDSVGGLGRRLADHGFVGEKPSADALDALLDQWIRSGNLILEEIGQACAGADVAFRGSVVLGELAQQALVRLANEEAHHCILSAPQRPVLRRLLGRDPVSRIQRAAPCPVDTIGEAPRGSS